jgi:dienelactone hydrolase
MNSRNLQRLLILLVFLSLSQAAWAASVLRGELARADNHPLEAIPGLDTIHDVLVTRDGTKLRTFITRPQGKTGRLPAILFVQWLSCDTVELPGTGGGGWNRMMRRVAQESGLVMMRTEKRGIGDSQGGPCSELDYLTELSDHRDALAQLKTYDFVDPSRIIVYGASMGANYAPLVAQGENVAGVVVWGGGAKTWFERMMTFERQRRELSGMSPDQLNSDMKEIAAFLNAYLIEKKSPQQIAQEDPSLGAVWAKITGTEGDKHYGRPVAFHQQAYDQNWTAAWNRIRAPVLVLFGEYDWFEDAAGYALIARIVNRNLPGQARFQLIPKMDHHFTTFSRPDDAVPETNGVVNEDPVVREILAWLREVLPVPRDPRPAIREENSDK